MAKSRASCKKYLKIPISYGHAIFLRTLKSPDHQAFSDYVMVVVAAMIENKKRDNSIKE